MKEKDDNGKDGSGNRGGKGRQVSKKRREETNAIKRKLVYECYLRRSRLPWWLGGKEPACMQEMWVRSLGQKDPLKKEMATCSNILAWEIPWTEESGGLVHGGHKIQT